MAGVGSGGYGGHQWLVVGSGDCGGHQWLVVGSGGCGGHQWLVVGSGGCSGHHGWSLVVAAAVDISGCGAGVAVLEGRLKTSVAGGGDSIVAVGDGVVWRRGSSGWLSC